LCWWTLDALREFVHGGGLAMNSLILRSEPLDTDRKDLRDAVKVLVNRGEMEVVTTSSGEVLYILQSLDG
jgi:hypothetical protein